MTGLQAKSPLREQQQTTTGSNININGGQKQIITGEYFLKSKLYLLNLLFIDQLFFSLSLTLFFQTKCKYSILTHGNSGTLITKLKIVIVVFILLL